MLKTHCRLIAASVVVIGLTIFFGAVFQPVFHFRLLDFATTPGATSAALQVLTPQERHTHILVTLTLDVIYPIAYGLTFLGLMRLFFSGRWCQYLVLATVGSDLLENGIEVALLSGAHLSFWLKAIVTDIKFSLVIACLIVIVFGFIQRMITKT